MESFKGGSESLLSLRNEKRRPRPKGPVMAPVRVRHRLNDVAIDPDGALAEGL